MATVSLDCKPCSRRSGFVAVTFGYQQLPLGFTIELQKFQRSVNPGRLGDAAFASTVKLLDPAEGTPLSGEIALNEPLTHGKFTFYQSSFQELPGNVQVSVLTAAYDPGRFCKYFGSLMICGGIFLIVRHAFADVSDRARPPVRGDK